MSLRQSLFFACCVLAAAGTAHCGELKPWSGGATPPLSLKDPAGQVHDLAAYRGKVVLVNFWATWCEPCRQEMPSMQNLRARFAGKPFEILAVNLMESEQKITAFSKSEMIDLPVLMDRDGAAAKLWKVRMLPVSFVVDRQGAVRYQLVGDADWTSRDISAAIERLMSRDTEPTRADAAR